MSEQMGKLKKGQKTLIDLYYNDLHGLKISIR